MRLAAFALVVAGAALMPGPLRAAEAGARQERGDAVPERASVPEMSGTT